MKKNEKPDLHIDSTNINTGNKTLDDDFSKSFVGRLIDNFSDGACHTLEARRLVNSPHIASDIDLILNDEEHSKFYKKVRVIDNTDTLALEFLDSGNDVEK